MRVSLLDDSLKVLKRSGVSLATFPGGYLQARDLIEIEQLIKVLKRLSKKHGICIALGIDISHKWESINDTKIKKHELPLFGVVISPNLKSPKLWRQRSTNNDNQKLVMGKLCNENRAILINNKKIETLMCGEIFNSRVRNSLLNRKVDIAIDLGHTSGGFRVFSAMKVLAKGGVKVFCSVHSQAQNSMKYSYYPSKRNGYKNMSTRISDFTVGETPRLELKVWEIKG